MRLQRALLSFDENLDKLAQSESVDSLSREAGPLRAALLEDTEQTRNALTHLPAGVHLDPAFLPTLETIKTTLPSQLDAITALARAKDWEAVRLRLAKEKNRWKPRPLRWSRTLSSTSAKSWQEQSGRLRACSAEFF